MAGRNGQNSARYELIFIILYGNIHFFLASFVEKTPFTLNCLCTFVEYQLTIYLLSSYKPQ